MRESEIKKLIGKKNWKPFLEWMRGQTVGVYDDGEINYYPWDVDKFVTKLKTGYDSQEDIGWD